MNEQIRNFIEYAKPLIHLTKELLSPERYVILNTAGVHTITRPHTLKIHSGAIEMRGKKDFFCNSIHFLITETHTYLCANSIPYFDDKTNELVTITSLIGDYSEIFKPKYDIPSSKTISEDVPVRESTTEEVPTGKIISNAIFTNK
jgi:hypothetical protein